MFRSFLSTTVASGTETVLIQAGLMTVRPQRWYMHNTIIHYFLLREELKRVFIANWCHLRFILSQPHAMSVSCKQRVIFPCSGHVTGFSPVSCFTTSGLQLTWRSTCALLLARATVAAITLPASSPYWVETLRCPSPSTGSTSEWD